MLEQAHQPNVELRIPISLGEIQEVLLLETNKSFIPVLPIYLTERLA